MTTTVIAWVTMDGFEVTGKRLGLYGERTELRTVPTARAVVWKHDSNGEDLAKAKAHAETITGAELVRVYTFPPAYEKCLSDARETVLRDHASGGVGVL